MPEDTLEAKRKTDKVPYDRWVRQGWITVTPGAQVDYHAVLDYIVETYDKYGWVKGEVCYDRYLATWLMQELADREFTPIDIPQTIPSLTEPTKDLRAKVYNRKIIHDNNEVLTWAMSNAIARIDHNQNIMLDKSKSSDRIDPAAALMNAHVRALVAEPTGSIYARERGRLRL
jgi:phage terminase large subunit-like protein